MAKENIPVEVVKNPTPLHEVHLPRVMRVGESYIKNGTNWTKKEVRDGYSIRN